MIKIKLIYFISGNINLFKSLRRYFVFLRGFPIRNFTYIKKNNISNVKKSLDMENKDSLIIYDLEPKEEILDIIKKLILEKNIKYPIIFWGMNKTNLQKNYPIFILDQHYRFCHKTNLHLNCLETSLKKLKFNYNFELTIKKYLNKCQYIRIIIYHDLYSPLTSRQKALILHISKNLEFDKANKLHNLFKKRFSQKENVLIETIKSTFQDLIKFYIEDFCMNCEKFISKPEEQKMIQIQNCIEVTELDKNRKQKYQSQIEKMRGK